MPYNLSHLISEDMQGLWFEGTPYKKENIYNIKDGALPPVNYDIHSLKPHSLTHIETPKHTQEDGASIEEYDSEYFYGKCQVIKLKGDRFKKINEDIFHWEITKEELKEHIKDYSVQKFLITSEKVPLNNYGFHDPNYVLTLSLEAAKWLVSETKINLYSTSWKSTDFSKGSPERPIHNKIFEKAIIMECLKLDHVPAGYYFLSAFPIFIKDASESPVTPILFTSEEIKEMIQF